MKKILSLGVAAAVVSMTAVAASAAIEPVILDEAVVGSTITVEIVANGVTVDNVQFAVEASDNLEYVSMEKPETAVYNEETGAYAWFDMNANECEDGFVFLTLTYNVVGDADEEVSVALKATDDDFAALLGEGAVAVVVDEADIIPDEPIPDEPTPDEPDDPNGGDIIVPDEPTPDEPDAGNTDTDNVPTGIALAVAPAVIAGAAIVVSKKRK